MSVIVISEPQHDSRKYSRGPPGALSNSNRWYSQCNPSRRKGLTVANMCLGLPQLVLSLVGKCFYELYINPLHKIAGPKLAAITRLVHMYHSLMGDEHVWVRNLHLAYGDTVRISPDQVSYSCADGWRDIYGHASATKKSTEKDMRFFGTTLNRTPDVIRAKAADHSRFRRNFSHAFSDKALREQQPLIAHYADLLIEKLREVVQADPKAKIEMVMMYNLTTFDIMGDLTFGDPLNLLKGTGNVGWVTSIFSSVKINSLRRVARYYPWCSYFLNSLLPRSLKKRQASHYQSRKDRVDWRVDQSLDRPDIWGLVMSQKESLRLSRDEMYANSQLFMVAGTETTATALSGLTYQLLLNPDKMEKITKEIRDAFERDSDIDMLRLAQLKYLNMCIDEGLRMYPPVPTGMPRLTPKEGMEICGEYMPGNVSSATQLTWLFCKYGLGLTCTFRRLSPYTTGRHIATHETSPGQTTFFRSDGVTTRSLLATTRLLSSPSLSALATVWGRSEFP